MAGPYPLLNGTLSIENVTTYMNTVTDSLFWSVIIGSMWLIMFMIMKSNTAGQDSAVKAFTAASFISTLMSAALSNIIFGGISLVPVQLTLLFLIMTLGGVVGVTFSKSG